MVQRIASCTFPRKHIVPLALVGYTWQTAPPPAASLDAGIVTWLRRLLSLALRNSGSEERVWRSVTQEEQQQVIKEGLR